MNISIEKNLQQYKTHIIDHATLSTVLVNNGYTGINDKINSKKAMLEFLEDDLRIDMDELEDCNMQILKKYYEICKSKKINFLIQVMRGN